MARTNPPRNELAIKLALGLTVPGVDVGAIIQAQRSVSIRALQDYTKSRRDTAARQRPADTARLLVLDSLDLPDRSRGPLAGSLRGPAHAAGEPARIGPQPGATLTVRRAA